MANIKLQDRTFEYCFNQQQLTYTNKNTLLNNKYSYKNHIKDYIGLKRVDKITKGDIDILQKAQRHLSEQTRANVVKVLSKTFALAIDREYMRFSPLKNRHKVRVNRLAQKKVITNPEELHEKAKQILSSTDNPLYRVVMAVLIYHAFRTNEILSMRWKWFDFELNTVTIPAAVAKNKTPHTFKIHPAFRVELLHLKEYHFYIPKPHNFVLSNAAGKAIKSLTPVIKIFKENGVLLSAHKFRNLFASLLFERGINIEKISKVLSHNDSRSIEQYLTADKYKISEEVHAVL